MMVFYSALCELSIILCKGKVVDHIAKEVG